MMTQQDFGRPLVLPGLVKFARTIQPAAVSPAWRKHTGRKRAAIDKAAEDGFLTWSAFHGSIPVEWPTWCWDNRHPPVFREIGLKYARVGCLFLPSKGTLPAHTHGSVLSLMKSFVKQARAVAACVSEAHINVPGVPIDGASKECASVLIDLLNDHLVWKAQETPS